MGSYTSFSVTSFDITLHHRFADDEVNGSPVLRLLSSFFVCLFAQ